MSKCKAIDPKSEEYRIAIQDLNHKRRAKEILEELSELNPDAIVYPEYEDALIGIISTSHNYTALYSTEECIEILKKDMSEDDAWDYFDYNTRGTHLGENTPSFLAWE